MFGSSVLDVAIGVIFIYLLLSLICTAVHEVFASLYEKRGKNLLDGIKKLLNDPGFTGLAQQIYSHGLIDGISQNASSPAKQNRLPSYISSTNFSLALLDVLTTRSAIPPASGDSMTDIKDAIARLPDGHTKESLLVLLDKTKREVANSEHQLETFRKNVENWFNDAMDRVSGWYKRWTQQILLGIALFIVCLTNADTLMLVQRLSRDSALRASLVTAAQDAAKLPAPAGAATPGMEDPRIKLVLDKAESIRFPLGWSFAAADPWSTPPFEPTWKFFSWLLFKIFGLAITVFAISLGAPFWFDALSRFVNLRGAGAPPDNGKKKRGAVQIA